MTKSDDRVEMSSAEWVVHERTLRKWKLVAATLAAAITILTTAAAWVRSNAEADAYERVRREQVHKRLLALEKEARHQSKRLDGMRASLCRLLWLQGETPPECGTP